MTLNITASQRVEGVFGALKKGRSVYRRSSLVRVRVELEKRIEEFSLASHLLSTKEAFLGNDYVEDDVLKSAEPLLRELGRVKASKYATKEMIAEVRASPAYSTVTLASGPASAAYLEAMAKQADDHVDVCCQVPEEAFKDDAGDTTMFGTPSLLSFSELVGNVPPDGVVKVVYKYKERKVGHIVVVGPNGFQLCTCLQLLRTGLQCRHVVAALVTELKRASEFTGASIHPRWRSSLDLWSIASAGLSAFDGHERGPYRGGFTDDFEGACGDDTECEIARKSQLSVIRARTLATMIESATRSARKLVDSL
ncbi:unnamed protein product, partial [Ascophyllum nodosum]